VRDRRVLLRPDLQRVSLVVFLDRLEQELVQRPGSGRGPPLSASASPAGEKTTTSNLRLLLSGSFSLERC
jgi:hypothetical protein